MSISALSMNVAGPNVAGSRALFDPARGEGFKTASTDSSLFGDVLKDSIGSMTRLEDEARAAVNGLMTGTDVDVHQAVIASEKASMAFEMVLAVRNKAVQSYQSVMSMQF